MTWWIWRVTCLSFVLFVGATADLNSSLLSYLRNITNTAINPALKSGIPDPAQIDASKSGSSDAGCIIPNPVPVGPSCLCHASADYSVILDTVTGLSDLHITNFTSVVAVPDASLPGTVNLTVVGEMAVKGVLTTGGAKASVTACGVSPSASGTASTTIDTEATLTLSGVAVYDASAQCFNVSVDGSKAQLHDFLNYANHVNIDLGVIHIDVGKIVDLLESIAPKIETQIESAVQGPLSDLMKAVIGAKLPCVPLGIGERPLASGRSDTAASDAARRAVE
jgi:hypothetical protein